VEHIVRCIHLGPTALNERVLRSQVQQLSRRRSGDAKTADEGCTNKLIITITAIAHCCAIITVNFFSHSNCWSIFRLISVDYWLRLVITRNTLLRQGAEGHSVELIPLPKAKQQLKQSDLFILRSAFRFGLWIGSVPKVNPFLVALDIQLENSTTSVHNTVQVVLLIQTRTNVIFGRH